MKMATIVLIPGAWIAPSFYQPFLSALNNVGLSTHHAPYPSFNPVHPATADVQRDSDAIVKEITPLIEDGKDVVLMMHSYAGMPGSSAALGLSKKERSAQGKSGGVVGLLYIAAFVVPENASCAGLQGGNLPSWILLDNPSEGLNVPEDPIADFAADVKDESIRKDLASHIKPHSNLAFTSPQPAPAWADDNYAGRLGFIVTTDDFAVPKEAQHGMVAATQKEWTTKEIHTSHCAPFLTHIDETVGLVKSFLAQCK